MAGYLIGSLSFSVILSRFIYGRDVRKDGSGNAGATNMARIYGIGLGIAVLVLDAAKAMAALHIGYLLGDNWGMMAGGVACSLGHCMPIYHRFKGGKGVVVALMCVIAASWKVGLASAVVFGICAALSRKVSLSSILGCVVAVIGGLFLKLPLPMNIMIWCVVALCIVRHKDNIVRLYSGREKDFEADSGQKKTKWYKLKHKKEG